ncbi:MAG TPA: GntR family transcriptional regulator [Streptosporangiaceae bacterium]|nr:GntR family transcriptional regulator [Streptosporangiaceae bacterium]
MAGSTARTGLGAAIQRQSTTEQAAAALREVILSGAIPPGTPLREAALAAELGISRNTVREAARLLGGEGLVRHQMNRGIVVAKIAAADVRDIYAARAAIETAGAQALTAHRDPAIYQRLEGLVSQIEDAFARHDAAGVLDGDQLFHATLVAAARSPRLSGFYTQLQQEQSLALSLAERSSRALGRTADDHRVLLDALRGTPARAKAQVEVHLQAGAAELLRLRDLPAERKQEQAADAG